MTISLAEFQGKPKPVKREPLRPQECDVVDMFRDALEDHGLSPQEIVSDGKIHRFQVGQKKNLDGYYSLSLTDYGGYGIFGNWQVDINANHWTSYSEEGLTTHQRADIRRQVAAEKEAIRKENEKRIAEGVKKAKEYLFSCANANENHPYIVKKEIGIFDDIQQDTNNNLIIPIYSLDGNVQTYQRIPADGKKKLFMAGGTAKGGFYPMSGDTSTVCICEGYATGWSIHQATGYQVMCAFNAGGLKNIAKIMSEEYSDAEIMICADNDHGKPQNTGIKAGKKAAFAVDGKMVHPDAEDGITDFNDLAVAHGLEAVANKVDCRMLPASRTFGFYQIGDVVNDIKPPDWMIKGVLENNVLGLLFGPPGAYKSFVSISWACCIATGTPWFDYEVTQGPVFYIVGEGENGIKKRCAAWSIANGVDLKGAPLYMSTAPMQALNQSSANDVADAISELRDVHGKPIAIFIDTVARNFGPGDENSTADMSRFISTIDSVMGNDCLRMLVHHTGHGNQERARGNSSLLAALDAEYRLVKNDDRTATLSNTKMKDEPEWSEDMILAPRQVVVCDKYEDDITSIVLECEGWKKPVNTSRMSAQQKKIMDVLKRVINENKDKPWMIDGVPRTLIVTQLIADGICDHSHAGRALKRLEKRGFIELLDDKIKVLNLPR